MSKICELTIQNGQDRHNVIIALVNAGYKVSAEERKRGPYSRDGTDCVVIVEEKNDETSAID